MIKRKAEEFLARDAEEVVMHLHEAKSIAEEIHLEQCTKPEKKHCGDSSILESADASW